MKALIIIAFGQKNHEVRHADVIEHNGRFWLVPEWLDDKAKGISKPVRMVQINPLRHSRCARTPEFVIEDPIPAEVLFEPRKPNSGYITLDDPPVNVPLGPKPVN